MKAPLCVRKLSRACPETQASLEITNFSLFSSSTYRLSHWPCNLSSLQTNNSKE